MIRVIDLADIFNVSVSTIYRWIGTVIPAPTYFDGTRIPFWYEDEIKAKIIYFSDEKLANLREIRAKRKAAKKKAKVFA